MPKRSYFQTLLSGLLLSVVLLSGSPFAQFGFADEVSPDHAKQMAAGRDLFKTEVRQVLVTQCLRCHGGKETEGEFNITTREGLLAGGTLGKALIPGKSGESRLMQLISHRQEPEMPQDAPKLSNKVVASIGKWIDLGAPYDKPLVDESEVNDWTKRVVDASKIDYWAFKELQRHAPPQVRTGNRRANEIDSFVIAKQADFKTTLNNDADDRILVRRLYLDLLGVPPTPAEVDSYLADQGAQKYDELIDRLLDDERFGERWARHWLDVARFAESHGFEHDYDRPHAFHYRDFVIKAFNQDLPYDDFVRWQIAGDEFAPDNPLAMMATGFLGAGVYPTQITANEVERVRYDALDDMVATVGTGMLGLTVGCARCHDHKFDPIPQADYYRLVSTFTKTVRSNISLPIKPNDPAAMAKFEVEKKQLADELVRYDNEKLPAAFAAWDANRKDEPLTSGWSDAAMVEFKSAGGATLTKLADGSVLASGANPALDTYNLVLHSSVRSISALRIETKADKSLPQGGPGRAGNGNFALSNLKVTA
ncbi:MAG: cytochrome c553, partial [Pirellulaceae bacterium]